MRLLRGVRTALLEVLAILAEMVALPVRFALRVAERLGEAVLAVLRVLYPILLTIADALRGLLRIAERIITPARGLAVVTICALLTLGATQFVDYRGVRIDAPQYREAGDVTQAPQKGREAPTWAHGPWVVVLAGAGLALTGFALAGRWRLARLLAVIGAITIALSLIVDAPKGLDEGGLSQLYEGTEAILLGDFWVQLASGAVLVVAGPLLAAYLAAESTVSRPLPRRRGGALALDRSSTQGARL